MEYYTNMLSLRADIQLTYRLLGARDQELLEHFNEIGIDLSLVVVESYLTIFTNTIHSDLTDVIIDHFMAEGPTVLLKSMVLLLSYLRDDLFQLENFGTYWITLGEILMFMKDKFKTRFIDPAKLDEDLDKFYLSKYLINELREFYTVRERQNFYVKAPADYKPRVICKKQWPICYKYLD